MTETEKTPARQRIDKFAARIPAGATVEISEETCAGLHIAQLLAKGAIDTIVVTVCCRANSRRTRASASTWFNSHNGKIRHLKVREIGYYLYHLYV